MWSERRSRRFLGGVILACALGVGAASCSSGPSASAKEFCSSLSATAPSMDMSVSVDITKVIAGENSGDQALDGAASQLAKALNEQDPTAEMAATGQAVAACNHLGIPLGRGVSAG